MAEPTIAKVSSKNGTIKVLGGALPCGHQLSMLLLKELQALSERVSELERITLPTESEGDVSLQYDDFEPKQPEPEPEVKQLSASTLKQLDELQKELDLAVQKKASVDAEELDEVQSVSSDGGETVCTEAAHKLIQDKAEKDGIVGSWLMPCDDDCKGCVKAKGKKIRQEKREERKKIKEEKKRIKQAKTQEVQDEIRALTKRILDVKLQC